MSIHILTGKPGGGKGAVASDQIEQELVYGDRAILTSLAVRVQPWVRWVRVLGFKVKPKPEIGWKAYLQDKYNGRDFDVEKRLIYLNEDEAKEFYLRRKNCSGVVVLEAQRDSKGRIESYDTKGALENGGVMYVIDEAWRDFGARDWQNTGKGAIFYTAQHRKLGDTVFFVTQHTKQIETALRQVAQDFWVVTNHAKFNLGIFRQPAVFSIAVFTEPPLGTSQPATERRVFRFDRKGLGGTFDTSAGTGVAGRSGADLNEKKKGLPWWLMIFGIVLIGFLFVKVPGWMGKGVFKLAGFGPKVPGSTSPAGTEGSSNTASVSVSSWAYPGGPKLEKGVAGGNEVDRSAGLQEPEIVCTGKAILGGKVMVFLSDGRIEGVPAVERVEADHVVVRGVRYRMSSPVKATGREYEPYQPALPGQDEQAARVRQYRVRFGEKEFLSSPQRTVD